MTNQFHTDNAAPCWKCDCTVATYTVDDAVSLIDVFCIGCHHRDVFRPAGIVETPAQCSAAHRAVA